MKLKCILLNAVKSENAPVSIQIDADGPFTTLDGLLDHLTILAHEEKLIIV